MLTLNHDGRYSSVGSDGAATWREYTQLPAAEFCIRGVPGLTIRGTEEFYLASGVTRVATICSLGWDDPEHPMSLVEERETGGIAPVELGDAVPFTPQSPDEVDIVAEIPDGAPQFAVAPLASVESEVDVDTEFFEDTELDADTEAENLDRELSEFSDESVSGDPAVTQVIDKDALEAFAQGASQLDAGDVEEPQFGLETRTNSEARNSSDHTLTEKFQVPPTMPLVESPAADLGEQESLPPSIAPVPAPPLPEVDADLIDSEAQVPSRARRVLQPLMDSQTYMPAAVAPPVGEDSDTHSTLLTSNLVKMRAEMAGNPDAPSPTEPVLPAAPVPVIRMSNGVTIPLDRTILLGRAPEASRVSLRELPRLVNVVSPNNDVSRTHAQVRVEGDFVLVTDLNSTNGVLLTEPGQPPRRLHPDEPAQLQPGVIVDLGDGVTFELEATP